MRPAGVIADPILGHFYLTRGMPRSLQIFRATEINNLVRTGEPTCVCSGWDYATTNDESPRGATRNHFDEDGEGDRRVSYMDCLFVKPFSRRFQCVTAIQF
jgi:hypothetical protein